MKRIYISGPMRGIPDFNAPEFYAAYTQLETEGWHPVSPAEGIRPGDSPTGDDSDMNRKSMMHDAVVQLVHCDAIYMLDGWEHSSGARAEHAFAESIDMPIQYQTPPQRGRSSVVNGIGVGVAVLLLYLAIVGWAL